MSLLDSHTDVLLNESWLHPRHCWATAGIGRKMETDCGKEVLRVIHAAQGETKPLRCGGEERFPYPYEVYLTPIDRQGHVLADETLCVRGKHISQHGLEFVHRELLPYRHMIASFHSEETGWVGLLLELTWCRFVRRDTYENGGRFLRVLESPLQNLAPESLQHRFPSDVTAPLQSNP